MEMGAAVASAFCEGHSHVMHFFFLVMLSSNASMPAVISPSTLSDVASLSPELRHSTF